MIVRILHSIAVNMTKTILACVLQVYSLYYNVLSWFTSCRFTICIVVVVVIDSSSCVGILQFHTEKLYLCKWFISGPVLVTFWLLALRAMIGASYWSGTALSKGHCTVRPYPTPLWWSF